MNIIKATLMNWFERLSGIHIHHWVLNPILVRTVGLDKKGFHQCSCGLVLSRDCLIIVE